jgi:ligand-binding sensor domain-containing protein
MVCWLALSASLQAQQYVFRAYRQAEGLKNLAVNALATDRTGFLWLGTENGVYRFLGSGFERFGPEQGIKRKPLPLGRPTFRSCRKQSDSRYVLEPHGG